MKVADMEISFQVKASQWFGGDLIDLPVNPAAKIRYAVVLFNWLPSLANSSIISVQSDRIQEVWGWVIF